MDELFLFLLIPGAVLLLWSLILLAEILSARDELKSRNCKIPRPEKLSSYVVLIPAHDESPTIVKAITALKRLMTAKGRILVVADNCTDDTAQLARRCGASVAERHDNTKLGKGYALDFGLQILQSAPPEVVIILDADSAFSTGTPADLAGLALKQRMPVQAYSGMRVFGGESLSERIRHFAWRLKNYLRPLGLKNLDLPCQLAGSGMAFPWEMISSVNLASSNLVEDIEMGINLATISAYPNFCADICVVSQFPKSKGGMQSQRERWEHGHLQIIFSRVPALIVRSIRKFDRRLFAMALDLSVPPISLLVILNFVYTAIGFAAGVFLSQTAPVYLALLSCATLASAISVAWMLCARDLISPSELSRAALHPATKLALYTRFITKRQREWVRTARK
ncbi:Glycosyltransferase, catalytic subunit of cellulose synthase and poly-beta-1,6-N-acetylglucosamine synthase [Microbulbifer donghaiensis]|uniref:Glycosyltransferase, catalytic subunit of cellulose synthase and poly-beta-1,6-N-acetylglucosamine synthase n=1 Tax=Microbulbifer donghaiensis TaxID=494016 RepID=A0A1M5A097_9GAMM|nr:glycosyltransferase family 2 protein [Microbulbifer donghaiensis]SHF23372.1 Glycosyltransferase, catalytic subunit of cellulose synthase and poly-beta-1,6-N-acetylglucosamine synthase [Microbulbifer donghaiensis]